MKKESKHQFAALAQSAGDQNIIELYRAHPDMFQRQGSRPEPRHDDEPVFLKLIQIQNNNQQIKTLKANVADRQPLLETTT